MLSVAARSMGMIPADITHQSVTLKVTRVQNPTKSWGMQRVTSTMAKSASGVIITGFEYTYDALSRITCENVLANDTKVYYTYDKLNQVYTRAIRRVSDNAITSDAEFFRDAAGNITDTPVSCFRYDTGNKLEVFNGRYVSYDNDGNMLTDNKITCTYDSANRLTSAGGYTYTYDAENVRIGSLYNGVTTTYTYNTNCKLSQLLMKTTGTTVTKYVYGNGFIGEEIGGAFKTYHFDYRGSTVAITDSNGNVTDTFKYDTYGKLTGRTGTSTVIFGYNGRDGVITDDNGLIYMRARYYSPDMKRFINADVLAGDISNVVTLNRYTYANGNPVSLVDPLGLSADDRDDYEAELTVNKLVQIHEFLTAGAPMLQEGLSLALFDENMYKSYHEWLKLAIKTNPRPNNIGAGQWAKVLDRRLGKLDNMLGKNSKFVKGMDALGKIGVASDIIGVVAENAQSGADAQGAFVDTVVDIGVVLFEDTVSATVATGIAVAIGGAIKGAASGSLVAPGVGTLVGAIVGAAGGIYAGNKVDKILRTENENGKSLTDWMKDGVNWLLDGMPGLLN